MGMVAYQHISSCIQHSLGVFVELKRLYCGGCVAGQGMCRHKPECLWHQFHHWTDSRLGIDRPPTLDACSWAPGGQTFMSDVKSKIHELQPVKHCTNIEEQKRRWPGVQKEKLRKGSQANTRCIAVPRNKIQEPNNSHPREHVLESYMI